MCLAKKHCCQTELKDAVASIAIFDTICASLSMLVTIVVTIALSFVISEPSQEQAQFSAAVFIAWFITACFIARAVFGLIASTRKSKKKWSKIHLITHIVFDVLWISIYLVVAGSFWLSSSDLVLVIVNFALNGYFDWILYSVWKSKEPAYMKRSAAQFTALTSKKDSTKYQEQRPQIKMLQEESPSKLPNSFEVLHPDNLEQGVFE